mmetsp:Transcript_75127/g.243124  ORF Transcript_75127/g.243124 Transcript_75127/m.243124 type:complete len:258 (+) Transcript_75127:1118-1891(+)
MRIRRRSEHTQGENWPVVEVMQERQVAVDMRVQKRAHLSLDQEDVEVRGVLAEVLLDGGRLPRPRPVEVPVVRPHRQAAPPTQQPLPAALRGGEGGGAAAAAAVVRTGGAAGDEASEDDGPASEGLKVLPSQSAPVHPRDIAALQATSSHEDLDGLQPLLQQRHDGPPPPRHPTTTAARAARRRGGAAAPQRRGDEGQQRGCGDQGHRHRGHVTEAGPRSQQPTAAHPAPSPGVATALRGSYEEAPGRGKSHLSPPR